MYIAHSRQFAQQQKKNREKHRNLARNVCQLGEWRLTKGIKFR